MVSWEEFLTFTPGEDPVMTFGAGAMSQLSPAAEPFSNLPGSQADSGPDWASGPWKEGSVDGVALHLNAQYQAEIASKCATELATYFQSLWGTVIHLQHKVQELEDWKKKALQDVRKLRDEHKVLRRKVLGEEPVEHVRSNVRAKTMPSQLVPMVTDSPPPGLQLSPKNDSLKVPQKEVSFAKQSSLSSGHSSTLTMASVLSDDPGHLDGVQLSNASVEGLDLERAEWRIGQLSQKLRGCMGRALVSSPFTAAGLEDLRLMVFPEGKELTKGPRSKRQRELYAKKVNEGPSDGCLKIKVPSCPSELELQYFLKVGTSRKGPFRHSFAENTVSGCDDFGVDWLKELEPDGSLLVCVEFVKEAK